MNHVSQAKSTAQDFVILRRNGHWCIQAGGSYFGEYATPEKALPLAVRVARDAAVPGARPRVVVVQETGLERVVWSEEGQASSLAGITSR